MSFLAWRRTHAVPAGTPCANCDAVLIGPWCHACGQAAHDRHRHAHHLIFETLEGFFHLDGRLARTLPRLVIDPEGLTCDYLAGKRASQIPPLRLLLVTLLIVFLIGGWTFRGVSAGDIGAPSAADQAKIMKSKFDVDLGILPPAWSSAISEWLRVHVGRALAHPADLLAVMLEKAHDFAFLMLPVAAFSLALIFVFRRRFVLFDHFVFSMHSLSFQGLLVSTVLLATKAWPSANVLLWAAPVHLFVHMRGVYGTGISGTLVRMGLLFVASATGFALLLAALVLVGLEDLRG